MTVQPDNHLFDPIPSEFRAQPDETSWLDEHTDINQLLQPLDTSISDILVSNPPATLVLPDTAIGTPSTNSTGPSPQIDELRAAIIATGVRNRFLCYGATSRSDIPLLL